ncbi:MAG: hypothetical protein ACYCZ0_02075 [Minisyncoccota bacterium]
MPKILFVDDEKLLHDMLRAQVPTFEIISAFGKKDAVELFEKHRDSLDAIVLDGSLKPGYGHTLALAFRSAGFEKPMVAASSEAELTGYLMRDGCDHRVEKKRNIGSKLRELFPG